MSNNGIVAYVKSGDGKSEMFSGNSLTVDMFGQPFYHEYNFYSVSHGRVNILESNKINLLTGLFVVQVLKMQESRFGYNNMLSSSRLADIIVVLPIKSDQTPDWDYMEQYIANLMSEISVPELEPVGVSSVDLNSIEWKEFAIEEIADVLSGVRLTADKKIEGKIPFIGARDNNNGIDSFIGNTNKSTDKNFLGVNYDGNGVALSWYHPYEATVLDSVKRLHIKDEAAQNAECYLFLSMMIKQQKSKYQYGYKFNGQRMKAQKILLPINDNGTPDWRFIHDYVKSIPNARLIEKMYN